MGRKRIWPVVVLVALGLSTAQAETLYKWTDSQGNVSYHDQPPPNNGYRVEEKVFAGSNKPEEDEALAKIVEKYPVVLYSVPVCDSCNLARAYLRKRKIPFTEENVEDNAELQQKMKKKVGSLSVPTITIGDKVMKGYVESVLEGELDEVGYPKVPARASSAGENQEQEKTPAEDSGASAY